MSHREVGQHGNQLNQNEIYNASHIPQHSVRNPQQWQLRYAQEFVQPGRQTTFIEQLAAQFRLGCASNQFVASLEQMQRSGETVECVMPLSNEKTIVEDNNVRLEGDTATVEYNTAFDEGNEDLFADSEDRFDHTSDDGIEQSQDDSSDDDCLYDSDIPICNNVKGETEPVEGVDVGDVQCDDPIYNNPIAGENGIRSLDTMLDDSDQERGNAEISCTWDKACKFSVCATKLPDRGEYWKVRTFHKVHTCTVDGLQGRFPTTSAKMISELMLHKIWANGVALRPKGIICEMRVQWGLKCLYGKAWQAKKYAKRLVFGPPEESFQLLPSYFYMLEQENPSIVTAVATDEEERFKYYFWSYGACIRGFRDVTRLTVVIDATHLKGRFKGVLFVAICKDVNECVYPVTFGIGHVKYEDSWTWFLSKLRDAVGCPENTMFISDQHLDIKKAIQNAYPEAHHDLCGYHLKKNFKNKFKRDDVCMLFTLARDCYKVVNFNRHMNQI
ncbi:PREDICTED: uncharacterized protein LOC108663297 [Theobroma cacao]|uniref:Uncharacterized protein LOC108663297 n=1 Tax=Theobroma cacao TaxID=3641 RepID=A0AB32WTC5_THECC|nr:PREDICTED: uncharacterized protein LOC108663297 [Theobroma cacao]